MPFLDVADLELHYSAGSRVGPVSFSAEAGEFVSLLGPSGCGKTTSLRCIAGFATPTFGDIRIAGRSVARLPPNKRDIGLVFQNYALFPHLSVFENVAFGLRIRKDSQQVVERRVAEALEMVGLTGYAERMPSQLSGGQQQRVALARSIVLEPKLLLLDEPLSNLDAKLRVQMRALLRHLQKKLNITTIYVTHDQTEALALSDRVVVMNLGKVCQFARPKDIYDRPATTFVADFIGASNLLKGTIADWKGDAGRFVSGGLALDLRDETRTFSRGQAVTALVRPECVQLLPPGGNVASANALPATVRSLSYVGDFTHVSLELAGGLVLDVNVRSRGGYVPEQGASVITLVPADEVYIVAEEDRP